MIETARLTLRPPVADDFDDYAALGADLKVMQFLSATGTPMNRFEEWRGFSAQVGHWTMKNFGLFTVRERETGAFVGRIGPWFPEGWPDIEVGWALRSAYWGRGYATEAARASIDYAFTHLNCAHVISLIDPNNTRSIRVAERLGERLERETTLPHLPDNRRILQYGISR